VIRWEDLPESERSQVLEVGQMALEVLQAKGFAPTDEHIIVRGVSGSLAYGCKDAFFDYDLVIFFDCNMPTNINIREYAWLRRRLILTAMKVTDLTRKLDLYLLNINQGFEVQNKVPFFYDFASQRYFDTPAELISYAN